MRYARVVDQDGLFEAARSEAAQPLLDFIGDGHAVGQIALPFLDLDLRC